jgi:hypothetical protein
MAGSALADIAAQMPESETHLTQEPAQSAVSANTMGSCQVKSVSYAGDEGGIVCHFEPEDGSSEVVVVSITHLDFDPHLPLAREIAAYQKHRLKRLRRLGP